MNRLSRTTRLFWLLFATLQLSLPAAAAWGDARLQAAAGSDPASHIEAYTSAQCARAHTTECILCRHLSGAVLHSRMPTVSWPTALRVVAPDTSAPTRVQLTGIALARPRAPPALLNA